MASSSSSTQEVSQTKVLRVPPEPTSSLSLGLFLHFFFPLLFAASVLQSAYANDGAVFGQPSLSFVLYSWVGFSIVHGMVVMSYESKTPNELLPPSTFNDFLNNVVGSQFGQGLLLGTLVIVSIWSASYYLLDFALGHEVNDQLRNFSWLKIIASSGLADFSWYLIHRMLNHGRGSNSIVRFFRRIHSPHHKVAHLDMARANETHWIDGGVTSFPIAMGVVASVLMMDLTSMITAYALLGLVQTTHHVNIACNIGVLRYVFMDNHAHKIHHCRGGEGKNLAAVFSLWDRMFGTFFEDMDLSTNFMHKHKIILSQARKEKAH
jgi:sterol desaturase/sphingolipid hydroxylase (fatty acid hydroxylase superfamily)